jgi:hypothetical protein
MNIQKINHKIYIQAEYTFTSIMSPSKSPGCSSGVFQAGAAAAAHHMDSNRAAEVILLIASCVFEVRMTKHAQISQLRRGDSPAASYLTHAWFQN